jgi:hypothetical protein
MSLDAAVYWATSCLVRQWPSYPREPDVNLARAGRFILVLAAMVAVVMVSTPKVSKHFAWLFALPYCIAWPRV